MPHFQIRYTRIMYLLEESVESDNQETAERYALERVRNLADKDFTSVETDYTVEPLTVKLFSTVKVLAEDMYPGARGIVVDFVHTRADRPAKALVDLGTVQVTFDIDELECISY